MALFGTSVHRPLEFRFPAHGVAVLESHHASDFQMAMQSAPYLKVIHSLCGEGRLFLKARSEKLEPGSAWLIPPHFPHAVADAPSTAQVLTVLCVHSAAIPPGLKPELHWESPAVCRRPGILSEYRRLLRAIFAEQSLASSSSSGIALVARTLDILRLFKKKTPGLPAPARGPARLRIAAWVHDGNEMKADSIEQAAGQLGLSRRSFTAGIRSLTGKSWLQWQREQRIRHARRLLEDTARSVTSIAFECGYEDLSSFYRNFKKMTGTSPETWRSRAGLKIGRVAAARKSGRGN